MIKLCGAVCIVAGTTCYGLFYAFQKKSRLWRLKQFKESLLCLSGQLRVARMTMPQALAQIGQKSRYDYLSQFYIFVSENLEQHTYSGFWETWATGIDSYVRDIYLTESDSEILKNIGSIPLHLDIQMQLAFLEENISELENLRNTKRYPRPVPHLSECRSYSRTCDCINFDLKHQTDKGVVIWRSA